MLNEGVKVLETGGKADFFYGRFLVYRFQPVRVDLKFEHGYRLNLGNVSLKAVSCPGHCLGTTTFTMTAVEDGRRYDIAFPDGSSVNPGYRVAVKPSYPEIGDDYRRTFRTLGSLRPDIWLAPHNEFFDFAMKRARAATDGIPAWVDPEGYQQFVVAQRAKFETKVERERVEGSR